MRKVFEVELSSQDGLCSELTLPATPYALLDALERLDLADGEAPRWEILRMPNCGHLSPYLDHGGTLFELNALAQRLSELNETELAVMEGLIGMEQSRPGITPVPLPRLIDLAYRDPRTVLPFWRMPVNPLNLENFTSGTEIRSLTKRPTSAKRPWRMRQDPPVRISA